jgi:hypothetical protein
MLSSVVEFLFCPAHGVVWRMGPQVAVCLQQIIFVVKTWWRR